MPSHWRAAGIASWRSGATLDRNDRITAHPETIYPVDPTKSSSRIRPASRICLPHAVVFTGARPVPDMWASRTLAHLATVSTVALREGCRPDDAQRESRPSKPCLLRVAQPVREV